MDGFKMFSSESQPENIEPTAPDNVLVIYPTTCRVCLKNSDDLSSIFGPSKLDGVVLSEKINYCVDIQIYDNDGLPEKICNLCEDELNVSMGFKKKCLESNSILCMIKNFKCNVKVETEDATPKDEDVESVRSYQDEDIKIVPSSNKKTKKIVKKEKTKRDPRDSPVKKDTIDVKKRTYITMKGRRRKLDDFTRTNYDIVEDGYKCKMCGKLITGRAAMKSHFKSHSGPMSCSECNKDFTSKQLWAKHYKKVHCSYTEVCHECGRAFKHQDHLKAHMKVHSMARPFECQYCGKGFRSKNNMQMHVRSHLNLREYSCEMCGVAYVTPSALRYHMMTHSGVKPLQCTFCDYRTDKSSTLTRHIRKHTGEKPFTCSFLGCNKSFAAGNELTRHCLSHTGEKRHACEKCYKTFRRADAYRKHMMKKHKVQNFQIVRKTRLILEDVVESLHTTGQSASDNLNAAVQAGSQNAITNMGVNNITLSNMGVNNIGIVNMGGTDVVIADGDMAIPGMANAATSTKELEEIVKREKKLIKSEKKEFKCI